MALGLEDKKAIVAEVSEVASGAISAVAADYRGLTVTDMTDFRVKARNAGVYLRVVRNTLAKRAVKDTDFECLADSLVGPIILAFSSDEPGAAARLVRDFSKDHEALEVRAIAVSGDLYGPESLDQVAKLPSRDEALSTLLATMIAPVGQLVRTLAEPQAMLARTMQAVADQKQASA